MNHALQSNRFYPPAARKKWRERCNSFCSGQTDSDPVYARQSPDYFRYCDWLLTFDTAIRRCGWRWLLWAINQALHDRLLTRRAVIWRRWTSTRSCVSLVSRCLQHTTTMDRTTIFMVFNRSKSFKCVLESFLGLGNCRDAHRLHEYESKNLCVTQKRIYLYLNFNSTIEK